MTERKLKADLSSHNGAKAVNSYKQMSTARNRDEMVRKHLKLVSLIVSRLAIGLPDKVDKRDLINAGVIGLIDAVNNFDPGKGVKFETYAKSRIRGSIIDELRSLDWIPRSIRSKSREIERAISSLIISLGRFPTDEEIAHTLDWDMDRYYKAIREVSLTTLLSLDDMVGTTSSGESIRRIETVAESGDSPLDSIERKELLDTVTHILKDLSEQERLVIALYYYEELTLKEIGMVLNVTESRISQIHTTAIFKLRAKLRTIYSES